MKISDFKYLLMTLGLLILIGVVQELHAADRFYLDTTNLQPGEVRTLGFFLDNENEYFGFQAVLSLPDGIEIQTIGGKPSITLSSRADNSYQIISNVLADGTIRFGTFSSSHSPFIGENGELVYIKVKALDHFGGGTVTVKDIIFVGERDRDVEFPEISVTFETKHDDRVFIPDFNISIGETKEISLELENESTFTAFQLDIMLPEGLTVQPESFQLSSRASGHSVSAKDFGDGRIRVVCFSTSNIPFSGSSGTLFSFMVSADQDIASNVELELKGVIFTTPNAHEYFLATSTTAITTTPASVESIILTPSEISLPADGSTAVIAATVLPEYALIKDLEWNSSNPEVAIVSQYGIVSAVAIGHAIITAKAIDGSGVSAMCNVEVTGIEVSSITLNMASVYLTSGETVELVATVMPENATDKTIIWSSSDEVVVSVDSYGKVTAISLGEATITATCDAVSTSCKVTVVPTLAESIVLNETKAELKVGSRITLTATVLPETTTDKTVSWSTSNESVATVDGDGKVTAIALGESVVTAHCGDVAANCKITVVATPAETVSLDRTEWSGKVGESISLKATVMPENTTDKSVVWTSSDAVIATVDANGKVTAVALGETTITATCGDVNATCIVTVVPTPAESVLLSETSAELKVGGTVSLSATVLPEDATDKTVTWTSSNESVAVVDANGNVTAKALGEAIITAKCGTLSATCSVTVVPTPAESVTLSATSAELKVDGTVSLSATVLPEDATDKTMTWSSSNESVAVVDANGNVTAVALGEATITASCGSVSATCKVTVVPTPVESVTLSNASLALTEGETAILTATIAPVDATDKTITWSSSDASIATVSVDGEVMAVKAGTATITATSTNGKTASCEVTVAARIIEATRVILSKTSVELKVGESVTLIATVLPENTTDKTVTWTSSNEAVATVDANGNVKATGLGEATITASCGAVSATCVVTVVATPVESVTISNTILALTEGEIATLTATVAPADATDKSMTWTSSDASVASVSAEGVVSAVKVGTASVTAASSNGKTATCIVTVLPVQAESVTLDMTEWSGKVGAEVKLTATVAPANTTDKSLTWRSSNEAVAAVDTNGNVTAVSLGEADIIAICGAVSATCLVTVVPTLVDTLTIDPTAWSGEEGSEFSIVATVLPEDATDKTLVWTSSDETVANVDGEGNVTVLKEGTSTITVATTDGSNLIVECVITSISGVEAIFGDNALVDVYDMNGVMLKRAFAREELELLTPGVYLLRSGNVAVKICIKD